jgi:phosphatidylserine synthase
MRKRRSQIKMRKGVYILPNLFTTGNLFCGFWAIVAVFQEQFEYAALAILLASVFDVLDGKVARLSGATSKFGIQYDSLADLISFGVAPALLAFSWPFGPTDDSDGWPPSSSSSAEPSGSPDSMSWPHREKPSISKAFPSLLQHP